MKPDACVAGFTSFCKRVASRLGSPDLRYTWSYLLAHRTALYASLFMEKALAT